MKRVMKGTATLSIAVGLATVSYAQGTTAPTTNKPKLICKRTTETGSLVSKRKECRTRAEWERLAQSARAEGERLIDDNRPRFGVEPI